METSTARGLGLTQQETAKLGAFGIVRESVKLFGGLHPSLVWIQFALVMPYTLYLIVAQYALQSILISLFPQQPSPPSLSIAILKDADNLDLQKLLGILLLLFLAFLNVCVSLSIHSAVYYAVGRIFNGRNATFSEVVHAVPHLWGRLFVTGLVNMLLVLSVAVVFMVFILIFTFTVSTEVLLILMAVFTIIFLIPTFIISLMYEVANGVTCFEDHCGISAFRKGKHILHNKWLSGVLLAVLLTIASCISAALLQFPVKLTQEFHFRWLVLTLFYVVYNSYLVELVCIAWALFYFSCAAEYEHAPACHHDDHLEAGYQPIAPALA